MHASFLPKEDPIWIKTH